MDDSESDDFKILQKNTDELLRGIVANLPDNLRAEWLLAEVLVACRRRPSWRCSDRSSKSD